MLDVKGNDGRLTSGGDPRPGEVGLKAFFHKLRKRRIFETLAAFIGGGWLLLEFVHWILVDHYKFPEESIDFVVISVIGALLSTLAWRWFRSSEKRPGNVKVEVLLVPLLVLVTIAIDLAILLKIIGIPSRTLLIAAASFCLGIAWIVLKSLQWAAAAPSSSLEPVKNTLGFENAASVPPDKSIAVLPFTDLSPQKDQDYFCDGMTEEIIADLCHVHELLVISRSSAMTFKGSSKTIKEIARELNVRYALEGSVRKAGSDLRITAQLIDASKDIHIWAKKYSGTLDDVFDIQEKVSRMIVDALKLNLTPGEKVLIASRPIQDPRVFDLYLRYRQELWKGAEHSLDRALACLQEALDISGENALINAGLANVHWQFFNFGIRSDEQTLKTVEEFIRKLFATEPNSPQGHCLQGQLEMARGKMTKAIRHFKQSVDNDPNNPDTLLYSVFCYGLAFGRPSRALPFVERALRVDPLNPMTHFLPALVYWGEGKYALALDSSHRWCQMDPEAVTPKWWHAQLLALNGQWDKSFAIADQIGEHPSSSNVMGTTLLVLKHSLQGNRSAALELLTDDVRRVCWNDYFWPWLIADCLSLIGEKSEALRWLEHQIDKGFINYPLVAEYDPWLTNIRSEERFKKLMERVKDEWEHFEE